MSDVEITSYEPRRVDRRIQHQQQQLQQPHRRTAHSTGDSHGNSHHQAHDQESPPNHLNRGMGQRNSHRHNDRFDSPANRGSPQDYRGRGRGRGRGGGSTRAHPYNRPERVDRRDSPISTPSRIDHRIAAQDRSRKYDAGIGSSSQGSPISFSIDRRLSEVLVAHEQDTRIVSRRRFEPSSAYKRPKYGDRNWPAQTQAQKQASPPPPLKTSDLRHSIGDNSSFDQSGFLQSVVESAGMLPYPHRFVGQESPMASSSDMEDSALDRRATPAVSHDHEAQSQLQTRPKEHRNDRYREADTGVSRRPNYGNHLPPHGPSRSNRIDERSFPAPAADRENERERNPRPASRNEMYNAKDKIASYNRPDSRSDNRPPRSAQQRYTPVAQGKPPHIDTALLKQFEKEYLGSEHNVTLLELKQTTTRTEVTVLSEKLEELKAALKQVDEDVSKACDARDRCKELWEREKLRIVELEQKALRKADEVSAGKTGSGYHKQQHVGNAGGDGGIAANGNWERSYRGQQNTTGYRSRPTSSQSSRDLQSGEWTRVRSSPPPPRPRTPAGRSQAAQLAPQRPPSPNPQVATNRGKSNFVKALERQPVPPPPPSSDPRIAAAVAKYRQYGIDKPKRDDEMVQKFYQEKRAAEAAAAAGPSNASDSSEYPARESDPFNHPSSSSMSTRRRDDPQHELPIRRVPPPPPALPPPPPLPQTAQSPRRRDDRIMDLTRDREQGAPQGREDHRDTQTREGYRFASPPPHEGDRRASGGHAQPSHGYEQRDRSIPRKVILSREPGHGTVDVHDTGRRDYRVDSGDNGSSGYQSGGWQGRGRGKSRGRGGRGGGVYHNNNSNGYPDNRRDDRFRDREDRRDQRPQQSEVHVQERAVDRDLNPSNDAAFPNTAEPEVQGVSEATCEGRFKRSRVSESEDDDDENNHARTRPWPPNSPPPSPPRWQSENEEGISGLSGGTDETMVGGDQSSTTVQGQESQDPVTTATSIAPAADGYAAAATTYTDEPAATHLHENETDKTITLPVESNPSPADGKQPIHGNETAHPEIHTTEQEPFAAAEEEGSLLEFVKTLFKGENHTTVPTHDGGKEEKEPVARTSTDLDESDDGVAMASAGVVIEDALHAMYVHVTVPGLQSAETPLVPLSLVEMCI
ncbi:uncharacterized protein EV422DRAFT_4471 [Fimicolochytrium jonesii]|uniref:uncharacterized protein n=1 Tax=Fimicolochytrium jonesii TaxID=1396493 RepID=UPI0022FDF13E|nr:uncharacterized protein EV422DRAFT_4471 [Fimicolochytrium jonesii]KAI8826627.1 hypothetical protein EV422DRAFT_4471 [Fimicolochytrium jonesii]